MSSQRKYLPINEIISLKGKRALVTGGAMGIGFAISYRLAEAGASVTIADLNVEKGEQASQELNSCGYQSFFVACDISDENEIIRAIDSTNTRMGGIDILVNNAGIFPTTPLLEMKAEDIEKILSVNVKGLILVTREVSRRMIEQKSGGSIINLASIDSLHPSHKGMSIYDGSKGAVLSITRSLAKELGGEGIRVNAIAPGGILTEGAISKRIGNLAGRSALKEFLPRIILGRMGVADDIGRVALFLASDLSAYMTGSLLVVDGGYLLS